MINDVGLALITVIPGTGTSIPKTVYSNGRRVARKSDQECSALAISLADK